MLGTTALVLFASCAIAQFQPRVVFVSGDQDPANPSASLFAGIWPQHAINNRGEVAFLTMTQSTATAIRVADGASFNLGSVPGIAWTANGRYGVNISDRGDVIFSTESNVSRWLASTTTSEQVFAPGMTIGGEPVLNVASWLYPFNLGVLTNDDWIAAQLRFGGGLFSSVRGVLGVPGAWQVSAETTFTISSLTADGRMLGAAYDSLTNTNRLIVAQFDAPPSIIAASGAVFPGMPEGTAIEFVDAGGSMRSGGDAVFGASLMGLGITDENRSALFQVRDGTVSLLIRQGDVLTEVAGQPTVKKLSMPLLGAFSCDADEGSAVITESGLIVTPVVLQYSDETATRTAIMLISPSGMRRIVLRSGDPLPDGTTIGFLAQSSPSSDAIGYAVNRHGQVAAFVSENSGCGAANRLLMTDAQGRPSVVYTDGDPAIIRGREFEFAGLSFLVDLPLASGGSDGRPRFLNDRGELAFWLAFFDPSIGTLDALVVASVPPGCDSIDFNNDGSAFDFQDIDAFFSVFSEGPCIPASATCNDIDFNNDGAVFDPCDIDSFLLLFSEGPCTPCGL
jgi:hypothetical protein